VGQGKWKKAHRPGVSHICLLPEEDLDVFRHGVLADCEPEWQTLIRVCWAGEERPPNVYASFRATALGPAKSPGLCTPLIGT